MGKDGQWISSGEESSSSLFPSYLDDDNEDQAERTRRKHHAYTWWGRLGRPSRKAMIKMCRRQDVDLTPEDVDLLPWLAGGFVVDISQAIKWMTAEVKTMSPRIEQKKMTKSKRNKNASAKTRPTPNSCRGSSFQHETSVMEASKTSKSVRESNDVSHSSACEPSQKPIFSDSYRLSLANEVKEEGIAESDSYNNTSQQRYWMYDDTLTLSKMMDDDDMTCSTADLYSSLSTLSVFTEPGGEMRPSTSESLSSVRSSSQFLSHDKMTTSERKGIRETAEQLGMATTKAADSLVVEETLPKQKEALNQTPDNKETKNRSDPLVKRAPVPYRREGSYRFSMVDGPDDGPIRVALLRNEELILQSDSSMHGEEKHLQ